MTDPNPYVAPIPTSTGATLRAALGRFTFDDLAHCPVTVVIDHAEEILVTAVRYDPNSRTIDLIADRPEPGWARLAPDAARPADDPNDEET
jgi:hypothetical protein